MTDRIRTLTVILDEDYHNDDVTRIVDAIKMVRGVYQVGAHVSNIGDYTARRVAKQELTAELASFLEALLK